MYAVVQFVGVTLLLYIGRRSVDVYVLYISCCTHGVVDLVLYLFCCKYGVLDALLCRCWCV